MNGKKRKYFLAVDFCAKYKEKIAGELKNFPLFYLDFVPWENLHLTLLWFGHLHDDEVEKIKEMLAPIGREGVFGIEIGGTSLFERKGKSAVLWLGVKEGEAKLQQLQKQCRELVEPWRTTREKTEIGRAFHPHVTLSRISPRQLAHKEIRRIISENREISPGVTEVAGVTLFETVSDCGKRRYLPVGYFELQKKGSTDE